MPVFFIGIKQRIAVYTDKGIPELFRDYSKTNIPLGG